MEHNAPLARTHDPLSSHIANKAIKNNLRLADLIMQAVEELFEQWRLPVTDDQILVWVEYYTKQRQQRNVIARARGLLEREGLLVRKESSPRVAVITAEDERQQ